MNSFLSAFFPHLAAKEDIDEAENKRTLQFDFSSLGPSQYILATQLVILVPEMDSNYVLSLYEVEKNGEVMGPLDSKLTAASMPLKGGWLEFTIHYVTQDTSHNPTNETFIVGITDQSGTEFPSDVEPGSLYDSVTPLLVVYTYDNTSIRSFMGERKEPKVPNVHDNTPHPDQKREAPLQDKPDPAAECQKHCKFLTYEEFGWPGNVVEPSGGLCFTYCDGECSVPYDRANTHSLLLAGVNKYHRDRNNQAPFPAPCCAPIKLTPIHLITIADRGHPVMELFEDVKECGCV